MERYQDFTDGKTFWEKVRWCKNQSQSSSLWHRPFQCRNNVLLFHLMVCISYRGGTGGTVSFRLWSTSGGSNRADQRRIDSCVNGKAVCVLSQQTENKTILRSSDKRDMSPQSNATRPNNSNVLVGYVFGDLWEKKCWIYTWKSGHHPFCHTDSSSYIHPRKQRLSPMNQQTQQSSIFLPVGSKQVIR